MTHQTWTSLENYQTMIILCLHYNQIKVWEWDFWNFKNRIQ
jgi:hypothetical protein